MSNIPHSILLESECGEQWSCIVKASAYLAKLYNHYNREFFNGKLPDGVKLYYAPKLDKVNTKDGKHRSTCAVTYFYKSAPTKIVIRKTTTSNMRHIASDLLHEMCHIALPDADCEEKNTNSKFQKEMKRLARAGAFYNIW